MGSSLLFIHEKDSNCEKSTAANIWMIDFAKSLRLPAHLHNTVSHYESHMRGDYEDGYMIGLTNLLKIFKKMLTS